MKTSDPNLSESGKYLGKTVWNRGFVALLITQFTVALNDNIFRWLIIPIGKAYADSDLVRTLGSAFLVIPFLIWTSIAGYITDRYSRRSVMIWCKAVELILLAVAVFVLCMGPEVDPFASEKGGIFSTAKIPLLLLILFLLGSQSTFFSPSKYGSIPDLVPENKLSEANGLISMTTMIACVLGMILGGYIFAWTTIKELVGGESLPSGIPGGVNWWVSALFLLGTAAVGFVASFFIPKLKAVAPEAVFPKNLFKQTGLDLAFLFSYRNIFWASIASAFFWGLASFAMLNIDKFAADQVRVEQQYISLLVAILSIGIGVGSVLCGIWSRGRIELGLVPVGAFGIAFFLLVLGLTPAGNGTPCSFSFYFSAVVLFLVGTTAGLYDIPLSAYIQHHAPEEKRGRIVAAYNFCNFSSMLLFTGYFFICAKIFSAIDLYPSSLLLWIITGILVFIVFGLLVYHLFIPLVNLGLTFGLWFLYKPKIIGLENVPKEGGALFVCNHVSYLDGFLLYTALEKGMRFFAHKDYIPKGICDLIARRVRVIRVLPGKKVVSAIKEAREGLKNGDFVAIFPEGGITRTGQIRAFEPGFLSLLKGNEDLPIVPAYIGGLFGSMFSYAFGSKIIFKRRKLQQNVILSFGEPFYHPKNPMQVQRIVEELGVETMLQNPKELLIPPRLMLRKAKKRGSREFLLDTTNVKITGKKFLLALFALRRLLRREVLEKDEKNVGLFVPMSVGGSIANAVLTLDHRVVVNLNMTFSQDILNGCIEKAGIKTILTSRKMLERFPDLKLNARFVCVEDLLKKFKFWDKLHAIFCAYLFPICISERCIGLHRIAPNDPLAIIFTSGSTGVPKGVVLTHRNLAEQARSFQDSVKLTDQEVLLGFLPFFHAFGYAGNFWLTLLLGCKGVFHYTPLEPKIIGELARKHHCTFIPSTPTFLRNFLRRCPREDFENVQTVLCGAEKLPIDLIESWEEKYGVRPSEGYGTTELSPCPCVNLPDCRITDTFNKYRKDGSVGRPLANIIMKTVDLETGEDLDPDEVGMILAKGPTVMKGYYNDPERTSEVISPSGWYRTGDVGKIDSDGFFWITGRQSRISKIGGEMVPHILIEEEILKILQSDSKILSQQEGIPIAITSTPDEKKGERIIVLHVKMDVSPGTIRARMIAAGLPHIWIPAANSFYEVEQIPVLGTGKLDLGAVVELARSVLKNP